MVNRSVLVVVGMLLVSISGEADTSSPVDSVAIRVYDVFGTSASHSKDARTTAEAILRDAGIESAWRECRSHRGPASASGDSCADQVMDGEVIVRIVSAPPAQPAGSLGFSYVDAETRRGTLATVFADRVYSTASRLRTNVGRLLGRVIAHEVGHLLLGTSRHSETGLMRADWTDDLVQRGSKRDWLFSGREALEMRRLLLVRAGHSASEAHIVRLRDAPTP
jgi:hypothetical protein